MSSYTGLPRDQAEPYLIEDRDALRALSDTLQRAAQDSNTPGAEDVLQRAASILLAEAHDIDAMLAGQLRPESGTGIFEFADRRPLIAKGAHSFYR